MTTMDVLSRRLNTWIRRWRLQRAILWSLRGLILGLAVALGTGSIGLYRAKLLREEYLALVTTAAVLFPLLSGLIAFLWRVQPLRAARHFDLLFHLEERVSTALEIHQTPQMHVPADILQRQLQDAVTASEAVNTRASLPLRVQPREAVLALALILLIGAIWFRGDQWFNAAHQARTVEKAVAEQTAQIEKLIEEISTNEALTEQQKELLTHPLQEAQQRLQNNPSLENSVSVLTSTGEKMQSLSDAQSQQMQEALKESGQQLAQQDGSPLQSAGKELAQGNYASAASQLKNINVDELSKAEQQQLADQLDAMADSLQSTNPELANQLRQAADAVRSGDTAAAQKALENAAKSLAQAGQQITFSQTASQAAGQLQQGARQVLAAGGSQQQANQQGSSPSQQSNGGGGSGSGVGNGAGDPQSGPKAGTSPIDQNNGAGNGGETSYEQIYAPQLLGGEGGPQVGLPNSSDGSGDVIGQGPTTPGDPGDSTVPYSEVYSQYQQVNNQAIENGEVPSQFMDIIKHYFDSLKP